MASAWNITFSCVFNVYYSTNQLQEKAKNSFENNFLYSNVAYYYNVQEDNNSIFESRIAEYILGEF